MVLDDIYVYLQLVVMIIIEDAMTRAYYVHILRVQTYCPFVYGSNGNM